MVEISNICESFTYLIINSVNSYDEPGIRSLFTLEIRHVETYTALSNMPEVSRTPEPGTGYVVTRFAETVSMQSYLIAFAVSDYMFIEDTSVLPIQRIYARQESLANGDGDLALSESIRLMPAFETFVGIPYALPKMDQFACPIFFFGAMENWGLVLYREPFILFNEAIDRTMDRDRIITIIAHEFAVSVQFASNF